MAETTLQLQWTDNSNRESGFLVQRKLGAGAYSQVAQVDAGRNPEPSPVQYTDTGLVEGSTYTYRVKAFNAGGESAYGNEATGITLPSAPVSLAALDISGTEIDLTWTNTSGGATSVKIERKLGAGAYSQIATVGAAVTSYADNGVTAGNTYTYRVRASNAGGDGAYSNEDSAMAASAGLDTAALLYSHMADAIVGKSDGDLLDNWDDESGNGHPWFNLPPVHPTIFDPEYRPVYRANVQNGLPAIQKFDQNRTFFMPGPFSRSAGYTFYFVMSYQPAIAYEDRVFVSNDDDGFPGIGIYPVYDYFPPYASPYDIVFEVDPNQYTALQGPPPVSGWQVLAFVVDTVAGKRRIYRNGVLLAEDSDPLDLHPEYHDFDLSLISFGAFDALYANTYIGQDALYGAIHDAAAVAHNSGVLQSKWGIP